MQKISNGGKAEALRLELEALARQLGPGAKLPKFSEICEAAGVAKRTLDAVLGELERDGLIVRRHAVGIFVSENLQARPLHLALVCRPSFFHMTGHSPIWDLLVEKISAEAAARGGSFECFFARTDHSQPPLPDALINAVTDHKVDAVLGVGLPEAAADWVMAHEIPVVNLFSKGHVVVMSDAQGFVYQSVNALVERGNRKIAMWMANPPLERDGGVRFVQKKQVAAFIDALEKHHLPVEAGWIEGEVDANPKHNMSHAEQGFALAERIFRAPRAQWPDGIVINDDLVTRGALVALRQMNVQVGRDVQIASLCNVGSPVLIGERDLILVELDPNHIVTQMFDSLEHLLQNGPDATHIEEVFVAHQVRANFNTL